MEVLGEFAKYAFSVLKRKRRNLERSVHKYVSIKISALTYSGRKMRFCVNAGDRLLPFRQVTHLNCNERFSALRAWGFAVRRSRDACAARGKVGPVMGLRPILGPPCIPPEAPPKRAYSFRKVARARVLCCGSFPPSLRSLR